MAGENGRILYEGPSELDGAPIVVVAVGIAEDSSNRKTGAMLQTYILRADMSPLEAVATGADGSICGAGEFGCIHRGNKLEGGDRGRSCYVPVLLGPLGTWKAYAAGSYQTRATLEEIREIGRGRKVRLGTYGDPAAVPWEVWGALLSDAAPCGNGGRDTGYTHQWRNPRCSPLLKLWVMASCDTLEEMELAQSLGWRTFTIIPKGAPIPKGSFLCPASAEAGKKLSCEFCGACSGLLGKGTASVAIPVHGAAGAAGKFARFLAERAEALAKAS